MNLNDRSTNNLPYVALLSLMVMIAAALFYQNASSEGATTYASGSWKEKEGTELVLLIIGSSTCSASARESFPAIVMDAKAELEKITKSRGRHFVTIGVALDEHPSDGLQFISQFGPFDEVVVGRGWLNSAAIKYMFQEIPGDLAIPQLIVLTRDVFIDENTITVSNEQLLTRKVGLNEIERWQQQHFALPEI